MALWRDPLDELIEELDRRGTTSTQSQTGLMSFTELQHKVQDILYGTDEQRANLDHDPFFLRHTSGSAGQSYVRGERSEPTKPSQMTALSDILASVLGNKVRGGQPPQSTPQTPRTAPPKCLRESGEVNR